jgi:hypothetical protein
VWKILADGRRYADWVVGAQRVRSVEPSWPAVGSKFHHSVGVGPLCLYDNTEVLEMELGRRLVLEARLRPLGRARVELLVVPSEHGTRVVMTEKPCSPFPVRMFGSLLDPLLHVRNAEALRRLESIIPGPPDG